MITSKFYKDIEQNMKVSMNTKFNWIEDINSLATAKLVPVLKVVILGILTITLFVQSIKASEPHSEKLEKMGVSKEQQAAIQKSYDEVVRLQNQIDQRKENIEIYKAAERLSKLQEDKDLSPEISKLLIKRHKVSVSEANHMLKTRHPKAVTIYKELSKQSAERLMKQARENLMQQKAEQNKQ